MSEHEKYKVLIVEDDKLTLAMLNNVLSPKYDTLLSTNGIDALIKAKEHVPDLILLDVIMPGMSGFDVLTELKYSEVTQEIPVIIITGLSNVQDEVKGFFLGAVDYITKPFNNEVVKARVKTHLQIVKHIRTIERLCMLDALLEIPNRRSFNRQINIEWARAIRDRMPIGILVADIDHFKQYNDKYGHPQGDYLLQQMAEVINQSLSRPGDFLARWGGEEFTILLPNTNLHGALHVAEIIRHNVEIAPIPCSDGRITYATISIGVNATIPDAGISAEGFISTADKALYKAKNNGRNRVCTP